MNKLKFLTLSIVLAWGGFLTNCSTRAPLLDLSNQVSWKMKVRRGSALRIKGKINAIRMNSSQKVLTLSMKMSTDQVFDLKIFRTNLHRFSQVLPKLYGNQIIADGRISQYHNRAQMIIDSPNQLKIINTNLPRLRLTKTDLINKKDKIVNMNGEILSVNTSRSGKVAFLNFKRDLKKRLTLVIFASALPAFQAAGIEDPLTYFYKKKISIKGKLKKFKGRYTIVINSPQQIQAI